MRAHWWGWVSMRNTFPGYLEGYSLWWDEMEPGLQGNFQNTFLHVIRIVFIKHSGIANFRKYPARNVWGPLSDRCSVSARSTFIPCLSASSGD